MYVFIVLYTEREIIIKFIGSMKCDQKKKDKESSEN